MTSFLIKIFIKDYENIKDVQIRKKYGELGSFVGIISNVLLFVIKIIIGIAINSVAIMADSFNNLSDSLSSIITLLGFKMGAKPPDEEHPFGHGRIEYISGFIVSFIIMLIGFDFLKTSFLKAMTPESINFTFISIIILIFTILVKIWQSIFNKKLGNMIQSTSLIATGIDSRNDALVTTSTIISLIIFRFSGINLDGIFGIIVSIFLIYSGISLAKQTLSPLLGEGLDKNTNIKIKEIVMSFDGVIGLHDILVHNYGPNKSICSMHVEIPYTFDLQNAHELVDDIEKMLRKKLDLYATIHIDPVNLKDVRIIKLKKIINNICEKYNNEIEGRDYRILKKETNINFIFELIVPYDLKYEIRTKILYEIDCEIKKIDQRYHCIINIETSF